MSVHDKKRKLITRRNCWIEVSQYKNTSYKKHELYCLSPNQYTWNQKFFLCTRRNWSHHKIQYNKNCVSQLAKRTAGLIWTHVLFIPWFVRQHSIHHSCYIWEINIYFDKAAAILCQWWHNKITFIIIYMTSSKELQICQVSAKKRVTRYQCNSYRRVYTKYIWFKMDVTFEEALLCAHKKSKNHQNESKLNFTDQLL